MDRHEVGLGEEGPEIDQSYAELRRPAGLHVGVVGDHLHPERGQPLGDQDAGPAEPEDAEGLAVELGAGEARAAPLAPAQRRVRRSDVTGCGEHQRDGVLGGGDGVGARGVDDHDADLGGGADVDVLESDPRAGDHPEPGRGGQRFAVHLRRGPDEQGIRVHDRGQQLRAVGAVAPADLEVGTERLDGRRAQLLGDENDGKAHSVGSSQGGAGARDGAVAGRPARRCALRRRLPEPGTANRWPVRPGRPILDDVPSSRPRQAPLEL